MQLSINNNKTKNIGYVRSLGHFFFERMESRSCVSIVLIDLDYDLGSASGLWSWEALGLGHLQPSPPEPPGGLFYAAPAEKRRFSTTRPPPEAQLAPFRRKKAPAHPGETQPTRFGLGGGGEMARKATRASSVSDARKMARNRTLVKRRVLIFSAPASVKSLPELLAWPAANASAGQRLPE